MATLRRDDLVYPELSYQIIGILFSVFNSLRYGYKEKHYQRAISIELQRLGIKFQEQVSAPVLFKGQAIGRHFLDFLIDNKVILEIKQGDRFARADINQVLGYLKTTNLKLAILARFSRKELMFKRLVNVE